MTFQEISDFLQEPLLDHAAFSAFWESTQAGFPGCGQIPFLKAAAIEESLRYAGVLPEQLPRLLAMAERVGGTPALARLAWHAHRRLVVHLKTMPGSFVSWPTLLPLLGSDASLFYLLIALSAVPPLRELHEGLGIGESVSRDTAWVVSAVFHAYERYSPPEAEGRPLRYLDWMRHHLLGKLFRIGRMEWIMAPFAGQIHVYSHGQTGEIIAFAEGGLKVRVDGRLCYGEEEEALPGVWESCFELREREVSGHPIDVAGRISRSLRTLALPEWEHRLSRGMDVLEMHIPAGGGMTPEACRDSFCEAARFFRAHFPYWHPSAFVCQSWIFASFLADILPREGNLVRLMQEVHLYPIAARPDGGLYFVFNTADRFPETLPPKATSVQRAVYAYRAAGNEFRSGGMFLLFNELPRFFSGPVKTGNEDKKCSFPPI